MIRRTKLYPHERNTATDGSNANEEYDGGLDPTGEVNMIYTYYPLCVLKTCML